MEITTLVTDFNDTLLSLAKNISDICPTSIIATNLRDLERLVKNPSNKTKFIDLFCAKVLQYKDKIDEGDDSFFMKKSYDSDLDGDQSLINRVFELKHIWNDLSTENRLVVKEYMKILCALSEQYFLKVCS